MMRHLMNIVENAQEGVKSMVEGTTGQDSFSEEDVLANLEFAQEDVDSHPELWQEIGSISGFRLAERTQPLEGQIAFIALRRGEVVASMGCDGELRGLLDDELYVWDADLATHSEIARTLSKDGSDLHITENGVDVNDCPPDWTDDEATQTGEWIKNNACLKAFYGGDFPVTLTAPDRGEEWTF